jgi:hypothetical protein
MDFQWCKVQDCWGKSPQKLSRYCRDPIDYYILNACDVTHIVEMKQELIVDIEVRQVTFLDLCDISDKVECCKTLRILRHFPI